MGCVVEPPDAETHTKVAPPAGRPAAAPARPGQIIERIGGGDGRFAAPEDTPFPMKGLPPDRLGIPVVAYEVLKPLPPNVLEGLTKGWFEQPGGGAQYYFSKPFEEYVDQGYLKLVDE